MSGRTRPPDSRRPGPLGERDRVQVGGQRDTTTVAETGDGALFGAQTSVGYAGARTTTFVLPDPEDGARLRDQGSERARRGAPEWWTATIDEAIRSLAATGQRFTADDVREEMRRRDPQLPEPGPTGGAYGGAFRAAARAGVIRRTGYAQSSRPSGRRHVMAEWIGARS